MSQIDDFLNDGPQPQGGSQTARKPDAVAKPKSQVDAFLADAPAPDRGLGGFARDAAAWAVKGAIAVPEAIVGLADIPTGGRVGKALENEGALSVSVPSRRAKSSMNGTLTPQRKHSASSKRLKALAASSRQRLRTHPTLQGPLSSHCLQWVQVV